MTDMNIEGTPHEKSLLVIFAYIIGFTAAFIAFNYAYTPEHRPTIAYIYLPTQTAAVADSEPTTVTSPALELVYENEGLYLHTGEDLPTLLSKDIAAVGISYDELPTIREKHGFHSAIPASEHFVETGWVYYCEQYEGEICVPMLYETATETLYVVQDADGALELTPEAASQVSMTTTGFTVGSYSSETAAEPWIVAAQ